MQALALDELHDDEVVALVAEVVDDADDARMVELREHPRLDLEARDVRRVQEALDRNEPTGLPIQGPVDGAHGAARDGGLHLVVARQHGPRFAGRHPPSIALTSTARAHGAQIPAAFEPRCVARSSR
jgi:hypothetical protein